MQKRMDGHVEMGLIRENFDPGLVGRMKEDGYESRSGSDNFEGASGDDQDAAADGPPKKKKYHRHTQRQIQELESYGCLSFIFFLGIFLFVIWSSKFSWICIMKLISLFLLHLFSSFFKECPHPDEKQRMELSRRLGLESKQIKFWFQNRRTQMKVS